MRRSGWGVRDGEQHGADFAVSPSDEEENQRVFGLNDEEEGLMGSSGFSWCAASEQGAHEDTEIVACDVDQVAFLKIFAAAQLGAVHAATVQDMAKLRSTISPRLRVAARPTPDLRRARLA